MPKKNCLDPLKAGLLYSETEKRIEPPFNLLGDKLVGLRTILEEVFYSIPTKGNMNSWQLGVRMRIVAEYHHIPKSVMDPLHELREFCNQPAHRLMDISIDEFRAAVSALADSIQLFSDSPIPEKILTFTQSGKCDKLTIKKINDKLMEFDRVEVLATESATHEIRLQCESKVGLGTYTLRIRRGGNGSWYLGERLDLIVEPVQPGAILHLFNVYISFGEGTHASTYYESMIVVEPDFVVDASDIGKCFYPLSSQPRSDSLLELTVSHDEVLVNKFFNSRATQAMLKGIILGNRFASFIQNELREPREQRAQEEIEHAWQMVAWSWEDVNAMFASADHLSQTNFQACNFRQQGDVVHVEETIISPMFGFQGRLDFIKDYQARESDVQRTVYEFKSGAFRGKIEQSDRMQAISYRTLIDTVYADVYANSVALIYLQAVQAPIFFLPSGARLQRSILFARNMLVNEMLLVASGKSSFLKKCKTEGEIITKGQGNLNPFRSALQKASKHENALFSWHFSTFVAHVFRENVNDRIGKFGNDSGRGGKFSDLWNLPDEEKIGDGKVLTELRVTSVDHAAWSVTLARKRNGNLADFRPGDIVIILQGHPKNEKKNPAFYARKGKVRSIDAEAVVVSLTNRHGIDDFSKVDTMWEIEKDFMEVNFNAMLQSLFLLLEKGGTIAARFMGIEAPQFKLADPELDMSRFMKRNPQLSSSQIHAIRMGLKAKDLLLIQGPPGTGKTSGVLTELVFQIMKTSNETIFLLAYTNPAVENILRALRKIQDEAQNLIQLVVNISSSDKEDPLSLQYLVRRHGLVKAQEIVKECRIFVGTIARYNSVRANLSSLVRKDVVIIDEASQITDPMAAGLFAEFAKVILIGDQNQLPPVSKISPEMAQIDRKELIAAGYSSYTESVFQRLWRQLGSMNPKDEKNTSPARVKLLHHFRMHEEIAELVNPFYGGVLEIGNPMIQKRPLPQVENSESLEAFILARRIIFIESSVGSDRNHLEEANRVARLVKILKQEKQFSGCPLDHLVGVISPWRRQVALIRDCCQSNEKFRIDTVERFQGSECKNIILSLATSTEALLGVLTSSIYRDGDLEIDRKLNVSISRAEERLIVLGEEAVLDGSPHYRNLIATIKKKGGFISREQAKILFDEKDVTK